MYSVQVLHLAKKLGTITLSREFRTDAVLLVKRRGKVPTRIPYEPGLRHRRAVVEDVDVGEEVEIDELEGEVDIMNAENIYNTNVSEMKNKRTFVRYKITAQKFFSPPTQPHMLTSNERQCIKYLHNEDPVQWDVKTLSESFPATPDTIKKIIKSPWTISPERAKKLDAVVQRNWELLAEGKLEAEPYVLEHMKKFVNRREVLLEQIKSAKFYLPEVKKEHVWNNGEFSGILSKYEKKLEKLIKEAEKEKEPKMITESASKQEGEVVKEKEGRIVDVVHDKIQQTAARPELANKDSFMFGGVTEFYSKPTTLDDFKKKILRKANSKKKLDLLEKAILEDTLDHGGDKLAIGSGNFSKNEFHTAENEMKEISELNLSEIENDDNCSKNEEESIVIVAENISKNAYSHGRNEKKNKRFGKKHSMEYSDGKERNTREKQIKEETYSQIPPDKRTILGDEYSVGKLLWNVQAKPETEEKLNEEESDKVAIDYSDPVRLERENKYYDQEVKDIEHTGFWNNQKTSKHKAALEIMKPPLDGPKGISKGANFAKTVICSSETYPERINIPKDKRGSGLTFKVKDCYYDDDGEFLYRVPGMTK